MLLSFGPTPPLLMGYGKTICCATNSKPLQHSLSSSISNYRTSHPRTLAVGSGRLKNADSVPRPFISVRVSYHPSTLGLCVIRNLALSLVVILSSLPSLKHRRLTRAKALNRSPMTNSKLLFQL